jgi:glyoxylase-like metal-dependent hydrolase (beta-lactamase superfamily II)
MKIKTFEVNPLQENCYVVSDETNECVIIDCGALYDAEQKAIQTYLNDNHLKPVHHLCTHGHFDHVFGAGFILSTYGLKPEAHISDQKMIEDVASQCRMMGFDLGNLPASAPLGTTLNDKDIISFGHHQLQVLHTPGHSLGSITFYCEEEHIAFSGDTLFRMSVGRTDLPGGSWEQLLNSLSAVMAHLPSDTTIYPGHGPRTVISDEVRMNPYFHS